MNKFLAFVLAALMAASFGVPAAQAQLVTPCPIEYDYGGLASFGSPLMGALVVGRNGEELGRVAGVTLNANDQINFLIVASCLPGMTDRFVAVPYSAIDNLQSGPEALAFGAVRVNVSQSDFEHAPSFARADWPNISSSRWARDSYDWFIDRMS